MLFLLWIITPNPVFIPIIHPKLLLFIIICYNLLLITVVHTLLIIERRKVHIQKTANKKFAIFADQSPAVK